MSADDSLKNVFLEMLSRVAKTRASIARQTEPSAPKKPPVLRPVTEVTGDALYHALLDISESLGNSYMQVRLDLDDPTRTSWAGTAHEIREILTTLLRLKAPDSEVKAKAWYRPEPNTSGPTQKQRVRYILQELGGGSKQVEVAEQISMIEDKIGDLVRATYSRASDAAHRMKGRTEAKRLLRYFEAFAHDLLNLE